MTLPSCIFSNSQSSSDVCDNFKSPTSNCSSSFTDSEECRQEAGQSEVLTNSFHLVSRSGKKRRRRGREVVGGDMHSLSVGEMLPGSLFHQCYHKGERSPPPLSIDLNACKTGKPYPLPFESQLACHLNWSPASQASVSSFGSQSYSTPASSSSSSSPPSSSSLSSSSSYNTPASSSSAKPWHQKEQGKSKKKGRDRAEPLVETMGVTTRRKARLLQEAKANANPPATTSISCSVNTIASCYAQEQTERATLVRDDVEEEEEEVKEGEEDVSGESRNQKEDEDSIFISTRQEEPKHDSVCLR